MHFFFLNNELTALPIWRRLLLVLTLCIGPNLFEISLSNYISILKYNEEKIFGFIYEF